MNNIIYFDHNSTTKLAASALAKMNEAYALPLNGSATHYFGRKGGKLVAEARQDLKNFLNAENYEVTFTASGTEATNMVIFGSSVSKILFSKIEHASVFNSRPKNVEIIEIESLPNGVIDVADLEQKLEQITDSNFLVSVMLANNESGALQPVEEISKIAHRKGGLIHTDIVQAVGKIAVDLEKLNVDFASISAHKINGPQGVGALLTRKGLDLKPIIFGGSQEKNKRAGTLNVAGIAGFGEACKLGKEKIATYKEVEILRNFLESEISKVASNDVKIFATEVARLPNTSYISIKNSDSQTQLINFDLNGICVSAGPACSSGTLKESRILKAMRIGADFSQGAIRVSLGPDNTKEEVERFIKIWTEFYKKTKK